MLPDMDQSTRCIHVALLQIENDGHAHPHGFGHIATPPRHKTPAHHGVQRGAIQPIVPAASLQFGFLRQTIGANQHPDHHPSLLGQATAHGRIGGCGVVQVSRLSRRQHHAGSGRASTRGSCSAARRRGHRCRSRWRLHRRLHRRLGGGCRSPGRVGTGQCGRSGLGRGRGHGRLRGLLGYGLLPGGRRRPGWHRFGQYNRGRSVQGDADQGDGRDHGQ